MFPKNRGTPKWMVYNGKPELNSMIWRYPFFLETPIEMLGICQFCDFWYWVNYRFQAGLFAAVHFRQICPTISRGGSTVLGNWEMVPCAIFNRQNTFTKRHLQKNLPTHIPEHLKSLGILRFSGGGGRYKSCWLSAWPGEPAEPVGFWKNVALIFEMFRLYLTIIYHFLLLDEFMAILLFVGLQVAGWPKKLTRNLTHTIHTMV